MSDLPPVEVIDEVRGRYRVPSKVKGPINPGDSAVCWNVWTVTDRYKIVEHLGAGAYGQVVRAQLASNPSQTVVIKRTEGVFRPGASTAKCTLREIAIMRRLHHPNIVKILDILEPEAGTPPAAVDPSAHHDDGASPSLMFKNLYVVLEDGGKDLKTFMKQQGDALSLEQIQNISRQICTAVSYLHSCGVVHRDLKPENILIDPVTHHVRIADFGLSRAVELPVAPTATALPTDHPSPLLIRHSRSELDLAMLAAGQPCDDISLQPMSLRDDFHTNGAGPV